MKPPFKSELKSYQFWKCVRTEFLSTLIFVIIGCGICLVVNDNTNCTPQQQNDRRGHDGQALNNKLQQNHFTGHDGAKSTGQQQTSTGHDVYDDVEHENGHSSGSREKRGLVASQDVDSSETNEPKTTSIPFPTMSTRYSLNVQSSSPYPSTERTLDIKQHTLNPPSSIPTPQSSLPSNVQEQTQNQERRRANYSAMKSNLIQIPNYNHTSVVPAALNGLKSKGNSCKERCSSDFSYVKNVCLHFHY